MREESLFLSLAVARSALLPPPRHQHQPPLSSRRERFSASRGTSLRVTIIAPHFTRSWFWVFAIILSAAKNPSFFARRRHQRVFTSDSPSAPTALVIPTRAVLSESRDLSSCDDYRLERPTTCHLVIPSERMRGRLRSRLSDEESLFVPPRSLPTINSLRKLPSGIEVAPLPRLRDTLTSE